MKTKMQKFYRSLLVAALIVGAPALAQASVTYTFNATEVGAFGAGPYGTITLNDTGTDITFTVTLRSDMDFVNTGGPHSILSFNALGVSTGDINTIRFAGVAKPNVTVVAPGTNPGYGSFTLMLDCTNDCSKGASKGALFDPLTFTVANAEYSDFGIPNQKFGASFAADVVCTDCNGATGAIAVTGEGGGGSTGTPVPEPLSLGLFGLGLLGLGWTRRRRN